MSVETLDTRASSMAERFGVSEASLGRRREFLRLGAEVRQLLAELIPWSDQVADRIATEFYDWQFSFPPTKEFFTAHAQKSKLKIPVLRSALERAQAGYFRQIFLGAHSNWDMKYFKNRLIVGQVHDRIDLPFKWYIGSYAEYERLTRKYLLESYTDLAYVARAEAAVHQVFNLDMQAIGESFLLCTLETIGLNIEAIPVSGDTDRGENVPELKKAIRTIHDQASALSALHLNDDAFIQKNVVAGKLGNSFVEIHANLVSFANELSELMGQLAASSDELSGISHELSIHAGRTAENAGIVSLSLEQAATSVSVAAASAAEMFASIKEIACGAQKAAEVGTTAVSVARSTRGQIEQLGAASNAIGHVVN